MNIPNVKSNHIEKTIHPCQFPVGLVERLVLALTNKGDIVFDPYMGVGSAGVASLAHDRRFVGAEIEKKYCNIAKKRLAEIEKGIIRYRSHNKPIHDPKINNQKNNQAIENDHLRDLFSQHKT